MKTEEKESLKTNTEAVEKQTKSIRDKIEMCIDLIFDSIKDSIIDNKVEFSRIEKYKFEKRIQWLLSIVLAEADTKNEIDEIVLESNLIDIAEDYKITVDLSYGNGFILKDNSITVSKGNSLDKELLDYVQRTIFNSIDSEIILALNNPRPSRLVPMSNRN
jgi:hypothetical protein